MEEKNGKMEEEKGKMASRMTLSRRGFLTNAAGMIGVLTLNRTAFSSLAEQTDEQIFREKMALAEKQHLAGKPIGDVMALLGQSFVGTPYVGHTLEEPGSEHLVVNLHGLDCLTFVETTLNLARCVKSNQTGVDDFRKHLTFVRYRSGIIDQYPSRLHYFSDWMSDNVQKKVVRDMTTSLGGVSYRKSINFMTAHTSAYKQLTDSSFVQKIAEREKTISSNALFMIKGDQIAAMQGKLQNGDIIGTVTSMEGMDISHTGLVILQQGVPKFLHASLSGKQVMISSGSLAEYVKTVKSHTGIVVGRPLDPA